MLCAAFPMKPAGLFRLIVWLAFFVSAACGPFSSDAGEVIPLAGQWRFALDRDDAGIKEQWFNRELPDKIQLPGILQAQGYGDEISTNTPWVLSLYDKNWFLREDYTNYAKPGAVKVPFLCQPPRHYLGAAWYQHDIEIPTNWAGQRVVLFLERPHWESRVWLDDKLVGTNDSLCVPHEFELGVVGGARHSVRAEATNEDGAHGVTRPTELTPGKHTLTVRVDNRLILPYRPDAHSVSDSLAQSWNGIVGKMELSVTSVRRTYDLESYPHAATKTVTLKGKWEGRALFMNSPTITLEVTSRQTKQTVNFPTYVRKLERIGESGLMRGDFEMEIPLGGGGSTWHPYNRPDDPGIELPLTWEAGFWGESNPLLYDVTANIGGDNCMATFGLRDFRVTTNLFTINGRLTYLRGTHHGGDFPLTGYPPTDVEYWRKLFATCKEWGLNHMRFHSFCPPEAAFTAADEVGIYLQIEPGMWNTFNPDSPMEDMLYRETERILKAYGNHPSFVLFSASNEPKGKWRDVLPKWAEHFRAIDPRHLYTTGTGFTDTDAPGPLDKVDYTATARFSTWRARGAVGWLGGDYSRALTNVNVPVVAHELGQWCAYPDFDVIKKFTGYMQPGNYEIFRDSAAAHGVLEMNKEFALASGAFQTECYKEEIEANLRTPGMAGFQLLDLHDYVGQGTALVGLLDPFWESKGYATSGEFRKFCNTVVPLVRLKQRVFTTADKCEVPVEIANFSIAPMTNATFIWKVSNESGDGGSASGIWMGHNVIPVGRTKLPNKINVDLSDLPAPAQYKLEVRLQDTPFTNDWKFWLYPTQISAATPTNVFITSDWDDAAAKLAAGRRVLFIPRPADLDWTCPPLDNVPIFWNRLMNPQWGRMLGLWCDTNHPALAEFPTDENCDWQWTQIIRGVRAINLGKLPRGLKPIVAAIDDWNRNWKLGVLFEARVGNGRLLVSAIDVVHNTSPVAQQLQRSLLDYMAGAAFQPQSSVPSGFARPIFAERPADKFVPNVEISPHEFASLRFDSFVMRNLGATAQADGDDAGAAIDGDPNTAWVIGARRGRNAPPPPARPHTLTISFTNAVLMDGLVLMNRQNDRDRIGDVRGFEIQASDDGTNWVNVTSGQLASTWDPQAVQFEKRIAAKKVRFISLSGFGNDTASALAELAIIYTGPKLSDNADGPLQFKRVRSTSSDVEE
jgi:beta-galactosidase